MPLFIKSAELPTTVETRNSENIMNWRMHAVCQISVNCKLNDLLKWEKTTGTLIVGKVVSTVSSFMGNPVLNCHFQPSSQTVEYNENSTLLLNPWTISIHGLLHQSILHQYFIHRWPNFVLANINWGRREGWGHCRGSVRDPPSTPIIIADQNLTIEPFTEFVGNRYFRTMTGEGGGVK